MTAVVNATRRIAPAGPAVTRLALRQTRRGAVTVVTIAAGMSALVAGTYQSTVGAELDPAALAALAENPAIRTLFGEPGSLDTAGGFTVWRTGTVLAVLLSGWGLLAATRITRGEEESGRWDLLLAGRLGRRAVLARHLAVLLAVMAAAGATVAGALAATGTPAAGATRHGVGLALVGMLAVALAALAAQVLPTRSGASGATVAVLGVGLAVRMIGDGVPALAWLRWISPYGLLALTRPYQEDRTLPLLVLALITVALTVAAVALVGRRDVRSGLLTASAGRAPRRWLLGSVEAFAVRRMVGPLAGWSTGLGAYFLLIGVLAVSMTDFLADNPQFAEAAAQAGFGGLGSVRGYTATLFALLAVPVGVFAAARLGAFAAAEADGRLIPLHAQPVTRRRLLGAELLATGAGVAVLLSVAAVATWLGAASVGAGLPLVAALAGAWNVLPVALLCLGAAVLTLGGSTRAVSAVGTLPAAGGFLLHVVAESSGAPGWVTALSPFAHLAAVPDAPPGWSAAAVMVGIATLAGLVGARGFQRRDLGG